MRLLSAVVTNSWELLKGYSCWMMLSFFLSGILHNFLKPEFFQRNLGNTKFSSLVKSALSGALLPICNCGVVPLGISLYYSGAYAGNVISFITATPVINPAAILICLAILGPKLTFTYVAGGFSASILLGFIANKFCGGELESPVFGIEKAELVSPIKQSFLEKLTGGLQWGFSFLGKEITQIALPASIFAAFFLTVVPTSTIQNYLNRPDMVSVLGACVLGAVMYVCAVAHIPFVGALIGAGASPGIAAAYLLCGTATNIPGLVNITKFLGKRPVIIYGAGLVVFAIVWGYLTNILLTDFMPVFDVSVNQDKLLIADKIFIHFPEWLETICAISMIGMFIWGAIPKITKVFGGSRQ